MLTLGYSYNQANVKFNSGYATLSDGLNICDEHLIDIIDFLEIKRKRRNGKCLFDFVRKKDRAGSSSQVRINYSALKLAFT